MPLQSAVEALAERLVTLAGDEHDDDQYDRPLELILDLWAADADLCREVILASTRYWDDCWLVAMDIQIAAGQLNDPGYLEVLNECAVSKKVPENVRLSLLAELIEIGFPAAISRFERSFKRLVRDIRRGRNRASSDVGTRVLEVCRMRFARLLSVLEELRDLHSDVHGRKVHLDLETRCYLEAATTWFREGAAALLAKLREPTTRSELRTACVFCLGCERQAKYVPEFSKEFREHRSRGDFPMRIACVEAIVYSSAIEDALDFFAASLGDSELLRSMGKRGFDADVNLLLTGVYWLPRLDDGVRNMTLQWLKAENKEIAAMAWLALHRHCVDVACYEDDLEKSIAGRTRFLRDNPCFLGLMSARGKDGYPGGTKQD
jgi:hypothetical protein